MTERETIRSAHGVHLGFDVGKSFHWACAIRGGEAVVDRTVANRRDDVRDAIGEAMALAGGLGVLVAVDQRNNIGSLVVREARAMGCDVAYLPGHAESQARRTCPGIAKNDRLDALNYELAAGQQLVVDTGNVLGFTGDVSMEIERIHGAKNVMFGGEGLYNTKLTGPGTIFLQTMPLATVSDVIATHLPTG